ncbi:hypothetical protein, partial [Alloprevotella tannerae]|uniref:hypothetical protein n=1 Tax=Alloprevotella tannerae TaxID=76122 RepID=UPI0028EB564D
AKVAFFFFSSKYSLQNLRVDRKVCAITSSPWQVEVAFRNTSRRITEKQNVIRHHSQTLRRNRHTALLSFAAAKPSFAPTKLSFVPGKPSFGGSKP